MSSKIIEMSLDTKLVILVIVTIFLGRFISWLDYKLFGDIITIAGYFGAIILIILFLGNILWKEPYQLKERSVDFKKEK